MRACLLIALTLVTAGIASPASAQDRPWTGSAVLDDPEWQKRFLGSYGFLSGAEPEIAADERELLPEVLERMKSDPQAAATLLEQRIGPGSSAALDFLLANLHFQAQRLDDAARWYESALGKFPDFRRAHKNLGLVRVQKGDCAAALGHLVQALELGDRDGRSYGLIGHCHLSLGDALAAEIAYRNAVLLQPGVRDWKLGLARALLSLERHEDAIALFEGLIAANPEDAAPWMLQANAYVGADRPLDAAVNLEAVRALGKVQSSALVLLGDIYMNAGMPDLAKGAYLEVVERDEGSTQFGAAYRAAELLIRARAHAEAQEMLASIDRRYPELPAEAQLDVLTLKARLARAQGREKEAAELLESITRRDGTRGEALLELAAYHQAHGNREKALLLVERAEKLEGVAHQALLRHAQILVSARDYARAVDVLRRALQIKSEPRVERYLASVEQASRR